MFYFIKLGKNLEFENKREKIFFNVLLYIKLGKKLEFENKRVFFFLNYNVLLYKVRKKVRI